MSSMYDWKTVDKDDLKKDDSMYFDVERKEREKKKEILTLINTIFNELETNRINIDSHRQIYDFCDHYTISQMESNIAYLKGRFKEIGISLTVKNNPDVQLLNHFEDFLSKYKEKCKK